MIETQTFRLAEGASEAEFLEADGSVQTEFFPFRSGAMRRTTARGGNGDWLVLVLWDSERDADASMHASEEHPATRALAALIDGSSLQMRRYSTFD